MKPIRMVNMRLCYRAPPYYQGFQRWQTKWKNQNAGVWLFFTIMDLVNNQVVVRVGQLLSLLLEYQRMLVEKEKYQDGHVYQDTREKTRSDLFTFLCNKLEKHLICFTWPAADVPNQIHVYYSSNQIVRSSVGWLFLFW